MKVPVPALKTATHRAAESALISLMTLKSHLLTDSFIFMWSRWKKMPHLPRKGELGLTAEEMCPNSKQESPCGNLPETLGPTVISPNLCPDSNSHSAIIRAFNMSQRSPRSNAWWKAYRSNQRFLIAAFPSFEVTWKELRRHSILWGKGETKAEIYPAKARTHKSVGKHPGIQWCLLFPEYFLINSLFTTRHAWSNWTYLLSIFSSVLQTGSKKKKTHPPHSAFSRFPGWMQWHISSHCTPDGPDLQTHISQTGSQACGGSTTQPNQNSKLKSASPKQNPDTLGQRLPNRGKNISLHCLERKQVAAKHTFPNAQGSRVSEHLVSGMPAALLPSSRNSVIPLT